MGRKNFILDALHHTQCIIGKVSFKTCILRKVSVKDSDARGLSVSGSDCQGAKLRSSDFSGGDWKDVDLSQTRMEGCRVEGLIINGHDIGELIREKEAALLHK